MTNNTGVYAVEISNLSKAYGRGSSRRPAVQNLSLNVPQGAIFGFVGPNGAGKTSTIRMMCTLLEPDQGDIRVAGHSIRKDPQAVRQAIGYMPDFFGVYPDMLVWEYLDFFAGCYHIPTPQRGGLIRDLLELVELGERRDDPVENLSRGMKQRLSLARTLLHDPQVLVLDEPASGLDPRARVEIRQLLLELANMGKTIFFSTHILADVAEICTHVAILEAGKLAAAGTQAELQRMILPERRLKIRLLGRLEEARRIVSEFITPSSSQVEETPDDKTPVQESGDEPKAEAETETGPAELMISFRGEDQSLSQLLTSLIEQGIPVVEFRLENGSMEQVFLAATRMEAENV